MNQTRFHFVHILNDDLDSMGKYWWWRSPPTARDAYIINIPLTRPKMRHTSTTALFTAILGQ